MIERMVLMATIVGVILFLSDLVLGWMTYLISPIPVIWVMAVIIGIIAGKADDAVFATLLTWVIGILLGCLIAPLMFGGVFWTSESITWSPALLLLPLLIVMWSTRGVFIGFEYEGPWIGAIAAAAVMLLVWLIVAPVIYLFSFGIAAIGGIIGKMIHKRLGLTQTEMQSPPVETPDAQM